MREMMMTMKYRMMMISVSRVCSVDVRNIRLCDFVHWMESIVEGNSDYLLMNDVTYFVFKYFKLFDNQYWIYSKNIIKKEK